jgi:hypothetical protein
MKIKFSRQILENKLILNFMKIRPMGTEFFRADGRTERQTDRHNQTNFRFSQFYERT